MAEPTVQVPVSLIEELREAADVAYKGPDDTDPVMLRRYADNIRRGYSGGGSNLTAAVARVLDVVADALVWQPTPTAEPPATYQQGYDDGFMAGEHHVRNAETLPAAPPRIADMVPGTTLDEALRWTVRRDRHGNTFLRRHDRSGAYVECWPRDIDPSTIRDVTPPAVTP